MGPQELGLVVGVVVCFLIMSMVYSFIMWLIEQEGVLRRWIFYSDGNILGRLVSVVVWLPLFLMCAAFIIIGLLIAIDTVKTLFNRD